MNKYKATLIFPDVRKSISVTIAASSMEEVVDRIHTAVVKIEEGPDEDSEAVSAVYIERAYVSKKEIANIYTKIFSEGDFEGNISKTVRFPDGMEMDICCCKDLEGPGWTEAVLFHDGNDCRRTETRNKFEGVWAICHNDVMYVTVIIPKNNPVDHR